MIVFIYGALLFVVVCWTWTVYRRAERQNKAIEQHSDALDSLNKLIGSLVERVEKLEDQAGEKTEQPARRRRRR